MKPSRSAKAATGLAVFRAEVSGWTDEKLRTAVAAIPAGDRSKSAPIIRAEAARRGL